MKNINQNQIHEYEAHTCTSLIIKIFISKFIFLIHLSINISFS